MWGWVGDQSKAARVRRRREGARAAPRGGRGLGRPLGVAPSAARESWRWAPPALSNTADIALRARLCPKGDRSVLSRVRETYVVNWS